MALGYLCLTGLLTYVTTKVSSSRNVILDSGCSVAEVCSSFVSSQAETRHCEAVPQLTMSVLKGFSFTLIYRNNRVMREDQEGEGSEG